MSCPFFEKRSRSERLGFGIRPNVYASSEMERMMKVQEVLSRAMAKKITWWQAAEIIGVSARTMRRWRERLEQDGYDGLADRRQGVVSPKRVSLETCETRLGLYRQCGAPAAAEGLSLCSAKSKLDSGSIPEVVLIAS